MEGIENKIVDLLETRFAEPEHTHLFVVDVKFNPAQQHLKVFVESDMGFTLGDSATLNRYLQSIIDEEGWLGEKYTLDVSSPGVSKPMRLPRQFKLNVGRKFVVKDREGNEYTGELTDATDEYIILHESKRVKEGKRKVKRDFDYTLTYDQIKSAKVQVSFKK